ncbi:PPE family protein PPE25 [Mycobacterium tuberculosis H37Rv] [Mycobacterium shimoidei]|uniref:PPE family protein PPE25 [Mycobacterium tuberculosis H37Rv] n=1 Tax=Mycobacterium shimoidei TaxID=29313 RepID=A0A375YSI6_MYCSH|nr:PPE family protein [Mycobacterium shimoidei]SRX91786.1 PPE family protein PPE25 [Mycobacterium tuberculosis H37Rv] [Mycobacterium shimoidei]
MDYGALPPEINSGRMYLGPGSGPMLAAAAAWDGLANDLYAIASAYGSVIAELRGLWSGPSSMSMAAAAAPYVAWLNATAARAEQTAMQAKSAAAAFEAAFAMTVPPPVIAANRAQLMMLIATNFFGQNFPAIAATEAQYAEMWAQDAVAMYGYAAASADASALTTFDEPPATTNPAGAVGQAAAVADAAQTAAGTQPSPAVPSALQALSAPASSSSPPTAGAWNFESILTAILGGSGEPGSPPPPIGSIFTPDTYSGLLAMTYYHMGDYDHMIKMWEEMIPAAAATAGAQTAANLPALSGALGSSASASTGISVGVGNAGVVGNLSVPPTWVANAPATNAASMAPQVSSAAAGGKADGLLRGIPLFPTAGRNSPGGVVGQRYGFRHNVMARPAAGG